MSDALMWVHEDEEGLRSLYPAAALDHLSEDIRKSAEAAEKNRTPDGFYSDIYVTRAPRQSFAELGLRKVNVIAALEGVLPRWRNFEVSHAPDRGPADTDAACFGFNPHCMIYAVSSVEMTDYFWFTARTDNRGHLAALRVAIETINRLSPAALADYWVGMSGLVSDAAFLDQYFQALDDVEGAT